MAHTVEEAKALWCPMARVGVRPDAGGPSAINDPSVLTFHGVCIGDSCAMWRWEPRTGPAPEIRPGKFPAPPQRGERLEPTHGYCGLAGRPL